MGQHPLDGFFFDDAVAMKNHVLRTMTCSDDEREAVVRAHPRGASFKEDIIQAFYDGCEKKPQTTFGNVKSDVLADKDPSFRRGIFSQGIVIRVGWRRFPLTETLLSLRRIKSVLLPWVRFRWPRPYRVVIPS